LDRRNNANLPDGNGKLGKHSDCGSDVSLKSPVRENCTLGSVRGTAGNRRSYRAEYNVYLESKNHTLFFNSPTDLKNFLAYIETALCAPMIMCLVANPAKGFSY